MRSDCQVMPNTPFARENARLYTDSLRQAFLSHYKSFGCVEHSDAPITSGIDPTVRFIGSHISVLKPYFNDLALPPSGVTILQDCVRTRNAKTIGNPEFYPHWGSFFQSMGALAPYEQLEIYFLHSLRLFTEAWGLPAEDVVIRVSAFDADLHDLCRLYIPQDQIEVDTKPLSYYRHSIGMDGIVGRNFNYALKNADKTTCSDVGNFIVLEKDSNPHSIEVAIGVSTTIKQIYGLDHVLDCHSVGDIKTNNVNIRRQLEDIVITGTALFREGLLPSNQNNRTRILKRYIEAVKKLLPLTETTIDELAVIIDKYQYQQYGALKVSGRTILNHLTPNT